MVKNSVCLQLVSADIPGLLCEMLQQNITATNVTAIDELTARLNIDVSEYSKLEAIVKRRGDCIKILKVGGLRTICRSMKRRPVFIIGILILLLLSLYMPTRVLFVRVEGNTDVPSKLLLQKAQECGIDFWASRKDVRSEHVKNNLLSAVPQLQWAGINTYGCVAVISVEEKNENIDNKKSCNVSSIISSADGIITECTVRNGTAQCRVGDAVRAGQLLVSGYTDCGLKVQAGVAEAEVMAQTIRRLDMITPDCKLQRIKITSSEKKYSLLIGKKLINFYIGSGISEGTCVKMYSKKYLSLPGGLRLPVAVIEVEYIYYTTSESILTRDQGREILEKAANDYLLSQMYAGQILQTDTVLLQEENRYRLTGAYFCTEMIGRSVVEERFYTNGQDH